MNCHPDRSVAKWRDLLFTRPASNSPGSTFVHRQRPDLPGQVAKKMNSYQSSRRGSDGCPTFASAYVGRKWHFSNAFPKPARKSPGGKEARVGLRPSSSTHVRRGERGAPVTDAHPTQPEALLFIGSEPGFPATQHWTARVCAFQ